MRKTFIVSVLSLFLIASCASLKPNPKPWTPSEKKYAAFFVLAHFADAYTTEKALNNPNNYETNSTLGEHPSDSKITVYFSLTGIGFLIIGHYWPDARKPLFFGLGTLRTYSAIRNSRFD